MNTVKCSVGKRDIRMVMGTEGLDLESSSSSESEIETDGAEERDLLKTREEEREEKTKR